MRLLVFPISMIKDFLNKMPHLSQFLDEYVMQRNRYTNIDIERYNVLNLIMYNRILDMSSLAVGYIILPNTQQRAYVFSS